MDSKTESEILASTEVTIPELTIDAEMVEPELSAIGCDVKCSKLDTEDEHDTESSTISSFDAENFLEKLNRNVSILEQMAKLSFIKDSLPLGKCPQISELEGQECHGDQVTDAGGIEEGEKVYPNYEEEEDFELPSEELADKIVHQVESYFTDFNIMKDSFLLKHVRRNKEGYVSLKLVASFRRVKTLTKDWRVVRYSLSRSEKLQLNEEGTKIRRIVPVPNFEDTSCAKTVLVFNVPESSSTSSGVSDLLSQFGEIAAVTVVTPGSDVPEVCTKRCLSFYIDLVNKTFALVEFNLYESAIAAMKAFEYPTQDGLKVVPLLSDLYKNKSKSNSPKVGSKSPKSDSPMSDRDDRKSSRNKRRSLKNRSRVEELKESDSPTSSPDSLYNQRYSSSRRSPIIPGHETHRRTKGSSETSSPNMDPDGSRRSKNGSDSDSSWMVFKRHSSKYSGQQLSPSNNLRLPENVVRLPRGPDGTIGFHNNNRSSPDATDITEVIKQFIANSTEHDKIAD